VEKEERKGGKGGGERRRGEKKNRENDESALGRSETGRDDDTERGTSFESAGRQVKRPFSQV